MTLYFYGRTIKSHLPGYEIGPILLFISRLPWQPWCFEGEVHMKTRDLSYKQTEKSERWRLDN